MSLFRWARFMMFQWRAFHSDPPMTNGEYDGMSSIYGAFKHVDPADGDFARYNAEPASKTDMWPWMIYVREEPDWDVIHGHMGLIRVMRVVRKLRPQSRWYSAEELGADGISVITDTGLRPIVKK